MGDRGGVFIGTEDCWVFLYTHYGRVKLISNIKNGLKRLYGEYGDSHFYSGEKQAAYIFSEMIKEGVSGCNISSYGNYKINEIEERAAERHWDIGTLIIIYRKEIKVFDYATEKMIETKIKDFLAGIYEAKKFEDCAIFKQYYKQQEEWREREERQEQINKNLEKKIDMNIQNSIIKAKELLNKSKSIINILVAGDSAIGKTMLITKYLYDIFYRGTITNCVDFFLKEINTKGKEYILFIWDQLGWERARILHKYFAQKIDGAIFAFDLIRYQTLKNTEEWMNILRESNPDIPIIFIGMKSDLIEDIIVNDDHALQFKDKFNLLDFLKVSAKTGENVEDAFDLLIDKIRQEKNKEDIDIKLIENKFKLIQFLHSYKIQGKEELQTYFGEYYKDELLEEDWKAYQLLLNPEFKQKVQKFIENED